MHDSTDPVSAAITALRTADPGDSEQARTLLEQSPHRPLLSETEVAEVLRHFPTHPSWCVRPAGETAEETHFSRRVSSDPNGDEIVSVQVQLYAHHPPNDDLPPTVALIVTEDAVEHWWPLPQAQARMLRRALDTVLDLAAEDHDGPSADGT